MIKNDEFYIEKDPSYIFYRKIEFNGKQFNLVTKNKDIEGNRDLYYYCMNHRTTKTSNKIDTKGNKQRINLCNGKIRFNRTNKTYIFLEDHSKECNELIKESPTNILEINKEIKKLSRIQRNFKRISK